MDIVKINYMHVCSCQRINAVTYSKKVKIDIKDTNLKAVVGVLSKSLQTTESDWKGKGKVNRPKVYNNRRQSINGGERRQDANSGVATLDQ